MASVTSRTKQRGVLERHTSWTDFEDGVGNPLAEDEKRERALVISPAQVLGSALAATSAAVLASVAGTAGTIIGAGVGSVVITVGAAVYTWWIRRTGEIARRTAAQVRLSALATQPLPRTVAQGPMRFRRDRGSATEQAAGLPVRADADPAVADETPDGEAEDDATRFSLPWGRVLLATAVVAVLTFGVITLVEGIAGRPVSSLTGGSDSTGTSVGHVLGSDDEKKSDTPKDDSTPAPSQEPSPTDEPGSSEVPAPTPTTTPSSEPTVTPSEEPVPSETAEPQGGPVAPTP